MGGGDFSDVSWHSEHRPGGTSSRIPDRTHEEAPSGGRQPIETIQPGVGLTDDELFKEKLVCTVSSPIKENDGTKDVFVSYLVTTDVSSLFPLPDTRVVGGFV
jgi:sorting nexin-4